jgi:hypothetical protein
MKQKDLHIPDEFQIMGQTFKVMFMEDPRDHNGKRVNAVVFHNGSNQVHIRCSDSQDGRQAMPLRQQERLFLHEVLHATLKVMGREEYKDEVLVDVLAYSLHQVLTMQSDKEAQIVELLTENKDTQEGMSRLEVI